MKRDLEIMYGKNVCSRKTCVMLHITHLSEHLKLNECDSEAAAICLVTKCERGGQKLGGFCVQD